MRDAYNNGFKNVDSQTFDSLKAAFVAAPSAELAKVLAVHCLELGQHAAALPYLEHVTGPVNSADFLTILRLSHVHSACLQAALVNRSDRDLDAALNALIANNELILARRVWKSLPDTKREQISKEISARLEQETRLKVVEVPKLSNVTEIGAPQDQPVTFDDVVGLSDIKKQISKKIILPFQQPSLFQRFKKKVGGGVLLYGPPGCGKTLLARATAGQCRAKFFNVEITDILDMYIGESEQKLHAVFEKARAQAPSVLFFDELEALAGKREFARSSSANNTVSVFLTELDGFAQANKEVLVLASTNVPWGIDSAFMRPGRFDRSFFVAPPDREARAAILRHHLQGRPADADIDFSAIAAQTTGYSGADLANLVELAADEAIEESMLNSREVLINRQHFKDALSQTRATTVEWLTTARNYARYANDGGRYDEVLEFLKRHGK